MNKHRIVLIIGYLLFATPGVLYLLPFETPPILSGGIWLTSACLLLIGYVLKSKNKSLAANKNHNDK